MFYKNLSVIEIENSTICNARCPQCLREELAYENIPYNQKYLPVEFFDRIPDDVYRHLTKIHFAGTLGDPCSAPNLIDVIKKIKEKNRDLQITISTNGGMKTEIWWKSLAEILSDQDRVVFAIDGLKDRNHIYRVNVKWDKLINNVKTFIEHGGNASWQFIVFKHNQHQVHAAKALSQKLKFKEFILKKSHRFAISKLKGLDVIGADGIPIEPPTDEDFEQEIKFLPNYKKWKQETKDLNITCDAIKEESVYIDVEGRVFPCCYTASCVYQYQTTKGQLYNQGWNYFWKQHGGEKINLFKNSWHEILNGQFYENISRSWNTDQRLSICVFSCGINTKSPVPITIQKN